MQEEKYFEEIDNLIKKSEVNKNTRRFEENYDLVNTYWSIGKLIVEAQGGNTRAKYGNELIKKWSIEFTKCYGKGYDYTSLSRFRQFYLAFPIIATVSQQLSWSHIVEMLPIIDTNKRNYYINLCIEKKLSVRNLRDEIKNNSYERLINKPNKIDIIVPIKKFNLLDNMKNPIIIKVDKNKSIKTEKDLEIVILSELRLFFSQLGEGFAFIDNQYKINYENKNYFIDILLFNIKLNCYVVVELKLRELKYEDKAQIEFYMKLVDNSLKEANHNKTIGIIITKRNDKLIANFIESENVIPLEYELIKE